MSRVGRPRLEDDTDKSWLATLERAEDLKRRRPSLRWQDVAIQVEVLIARSANTDSASGRSTVAEIPAISRRFASLD